LFNTSSELFKKDMPMGSNASTMVAGDLVDFYPCHKLFPSMHHIILADGGIFTCEEIHASRVVARGVSGKFP
jgi:hypothetical protein